MPSVLTAKTVPELKKEMPELLPASAVPYRVLPDKTKPAIGLAPSVLAKKLSAVKLCKFVKPVPSVLTANTVPFPALPPPAAVPYKVLSDKIKLAYGLAPSLLV